MVSILLLPGTVTHSAQKPDYQEEWKPVMGQLCPFKFDEPNNLQRLSEHALFIITHIVSLSCYSDLTCTAEFCQQSYFSCKCENNGAPLLMELCWRRGYLLAWLMLQGEIKQHPNWQKPPLIHTASSPGCCARIAVLKLGCPQRLCRRVELSEIINLKKVEMETNVKEGIMVLLIRHHREGHAFCETLDMLNSVAKALFL